MRPYSPSSAKATPKSIHTGVNPNDSYLAKSPPKDFSICKQCHAIFHNKHWSLDEAFRAQLEKKGNLAYTLCPACQKIHDHFPSGVLLLKGGFMKEHKDEIIHRIKNEEKKAAGFNPLARIIDIHERNGILEISTTNEKLAQRIGKSLHKAYKGELLYKWSENNKFMRVEWMRE